MGDGLSTLGVGGESRRSAHIFWSLVRRSVRATGAVFPVQSVKVSCSDWMAWICSLERDDVPPWRADTSFCSPWVTWSAGVTVGWVMWWCRNYVISDITIDLESLRFTNWHL